MSGSCMPHSPAPLTGKGPDSNHIVHNVGVNMGALGIA